MKVFDLDKLDNVTCACGKRAVKSIVYTDYTEKYKYDGREYSPVRIKRYCQECFNNERP